MIILAIYLKPQYNTAYYIKVVLLFKIMREVGGLFVR